MVDVRKNQEQFEIQVRRIVVPADIYERIVNNGVDEVECEAIGFNVDKQSWHEVRDDEVDGVIIHILVAEAFDDLAEGDFLRLEISCES